MGCCFNENEDLRQYPGARPGYNTYPSNSYGGYSGNDYGGGPDFNHHDHCNNGGGSNHGGS